MTADRIDPDKAAGKVDGKVDLDFLKQEFQRFRSELSGAKGKLGAGASEALDQMSAYLHSDGVTSRINAIEAELESLGAKLKGYSKEGVTKLEHEVSERPITSIALAFGVGLLAAQFFRR